MKIHLEYEEVSAVLREYFTKKFNFDYEATEDNSWFDVCFQNADLEYDNVSFIVTLDDKKLEIRE